MQLHFLITINRLPHLDSLFIFNWLMDILLSGRYQLKIHWFTWLQHKAKKGLLWSDAVLYDLDLAVDGYMLNAPGEQQAQ